ncbi:(2Fe-2S)-binding protein [Mycolicibacterium frederiksbergense]|uniref:(2Fe-2S)-binding protein n=1 Tax=Mycolicibacterium frederiksbergense TaxID=117567 RepID=UPI0021F37550|nr:(2Fe-2S)-binding protein [Mycolicibacterium frederiksbergense]
MSTGTDVLEELSRMGGYFALAPVGPDAVPYPQLATTEFVTRFADATRTAIAASVRVPVHTVEARAAASSFQLGVAARLLSPMIAVALCRQAIPVLTPNNLFFSAQNHAPVFSVADIEIRAARDTESAARGISELLPELFEPLHLTLRGVAALSPLVSTGNVASAANGAVTVLAMTHPRVEPAGRALVAALLAHAPLTGAGRLDRGNFTRHSCCLFYKVPGAGLCGDCVISR